MICNGCFDEIVGFYFTDRGGNYEGWLLCQKCYNVVCVCKGL